MCSLSTRLQVTTHHIRTSKEVQHTVDLQAVVFWNSLIEKLSSAIECFTCVTVKNLTVDIFKSSHLHIFLVQCLKVEPIAMKDKLFVFGFRLLG